MDRRILTGIAAGVLEAIEVVLEGPIVLGNQSQDQLPGSRCRGLPAGRPQPMARIVPL